MSSLALGLFIIYFCFISCCLYEPKSTEDKRKAENPPKSNFGITPQVVRIALKESDPDPIEVSEVPKVKTTPVAVVEQVIVKPAARAKEKETAINAVNLDNLCLRHARIACRQLGIKQNQKLARLQKEIATAIKQNPQMKAVIYAAIRDKDPNAIVPDIEQFNIYKAA